MVLLTTMSQSAIVPEQVCLKQPFELRLSHCRSLEDNKFHRRGPAKNKLSKVSK